MILIIMCNYLQYSWSLSNDVIPRTDSPPSALYNSAVSLDCRHSHTAVNGEAELVCRLLRVSGVFVGAGQPNSWGGTAAEALFVQCLTEGMWRDGGWEKVQ